MFPCLAPLTSRVLRGAALALVLSALAPATATALVMCGLTDRSTGELREGAPIRVRSACRSSETQVDPIALGLQGPPGESGPAGADGLAGAPGTAGRDGIDGIACWDLDADFTCDPEEDLAEPFGCDPADCAGPRLDSCALRGLSAPLTAAPVSTACEPGERCVIGQCNGGCGGANLALMACDHQVAYPIYGRVVCCQ